MAYAQADSIADAWPCAVPVPVACHKQREVSRFMNQYEDLLVDVLLDRGFTVDEAMRLIALQERIEHERREEEERRKFSQWMTTIYGTNDSN